MLPLTAQAAAHCRAPETSAGVVAAATTVLLAAALLLLLLEEVGMLRESLGPARRCERLAAGATRARGGGKPGTMSGCTVSRFRCDGNAQSPAQVRWFFYLFLPP